MKRNLLLAFALASVFALSTFGAYAQSDEEKQEKKPEQSQLIVAQSDEDKKDEKKPEQSQLIVAQSDEDKKDEKKPELIA
jgi:outer membrane biosynthesis protein TonB